MITDREKLILRSLWKAWYELNEIHARDGIPYKHDGTPSSVEYTYFASVIDEMRSIIETFTEQAITPWLLDELMDSKYDNIASRIGKDLPIEHISEIYESGR